MFLWANCLGALFYLKVVTARVHAVFKCSFTSPYGDGTPFSVVIRVIYHPAQDVIYNNTLVSTTQI